MKCPICEKEVKLDDPEMPFCSERCRMTDLGAWATESYRIAAKPAEDEGDASSNDTEA